MLLPEHIKQDKEYVLALDLHGDAIKFRAARLAGLTRPLVWHQALLEELTLAMACGVYTLTPASLWGKICERHGDYPGYAVEPDGTNSHHYLSFCATLGEIQALLLGYDMAELEVPTSEYMEGHYDDAFHLPYLQQVQDQLEYVLRQYSSCDEQVLNPSSTIYREMQHHFARLWLSNPFGLGSALMTYPSVSRMLSAKGIGVDETPGVRALLWTLEQAIAACGDSPDSPEQVEDYQRVALFWMLLKGIAWDMAKNNGNVNGFVKDQVFLERFASALVTGKNLASSLRETEQGMDPYSRTSWGGGLYSDTPSYAASQAATEELVELIRQRTEQERQRIEEWARIDAYLR